jgi:hypothetical protein
LPKEIMEIFETYDKLERTYKQNIIDIFHKHIPELKRIKPTAITSTKHVLLHFV